MVFSPVSTWTVTSASAAERIAELAPEEWTWNPDAIATTVTTVSRLTHQIIEADIAFNVKRGSE